LSAKQTDVYTSWQMHLPVFISTTIYAEAQPKHGKK